MKINSKEKPLIISSRTCRFCDIVAGKYYYDGIDQPFGSNEDFIALASIGALVEGWSLIVPREHQLSMRNLYGNPNFINLLKEVSNTLINQYGPLVAFEHGAYKEGSITACGTDHAHFHLVPLEYSLLNAMEASGLSWKKCHSTDIKSIAGENEYLFYTDLISKTFSNDFEGYLHILEKPISQFFRQLIACQEGLSEVSDYRQFPHIERAQQTRKIFVETSI